ncbi:MAG: PAS domain S-box protein [Candidatus Omnitrophota bacterium]
MNNSVHILLIEQDPRDARLISKILSDVNGFSISLKYVNTLQEGQQYLNRADFDIVFLDLYLSDSQGLNAFIKIHEQVPFLPIIVMSGFEDDTFAREAVRRGAQDYLIKDRLNSQMIARVITHAIERKRAEEASREMEEKYKQIFENIWAGVAHVNLEGIITFVSHHFCEIFEVQKKDVLGLHFREFVHPNLHKKAEKLFQEAVQSGLLPAIPHEMVGVTKSGRAIDIELRSTALLSKGDLIGFQVMIQDVTEYKKAKARRRETETKMKLLIDNLPDLVITIDREGKILFVNRSREGFPPPQEAIGTNLIDYLAVQEKSRYQEDIRRAFETGEIIRNEYVDRLGRSYLTRCVPIKEDEQIISAMIIAHDITDTKRAQEIERHQKELRDFIASTSAEFVNIDTELVDAAINKALESIARLLHVDRAYVFLLRKDQTIIDNTHEWCAADVRPQKPDFQNIPIDHFPWFKERILNEGIVNVPCVAALGPEANIEKTTFMAQPVKSFLSVAMECGKNLIGIIGLDAVKEEKEWPEETISLLKILGDILANALERKKKEELLRDSENRYRAVVETQTELICRWKPPDFTLTFVNETYCQLFGKAREELIGESFLALIPAQEHPKIREHFAALSPDHPVLSHEHKVIDADGHMRCQRWINRGIFDDNGRLIECQDVGRDITEQRETQQALQESETKFRMFMDYTHDWETFRDKDEKLTYVSPAFERITGYAAQDYLTGKIKLANLVHPDDREKHKRLFEKYLKREALADQELKMFKKDGSLIFISISAQPVFNEADKFVGFRTSARDITERKISEEVLRESEIKYRVLFEASTDAIFLETLDGRILDCNEAACKMYGYTKDEITALRVDEIVPEDITKKLPHIVEEALNKGYVFVTAAGKRKNGQIFPTEVSIRVTTIGQEQRVIVFVRDVTKRKITEEALQESEEQYRLITENIPLHLGSIDQSGQFTLWNKFSEKMFGYKSEEVISKLSPSIIHVSEDEARTVIQIATEDGIFDKEINLKRKDGTIFPAHLIVVSRKDHQGRIIGYHGFAEDITQRKKAEEAAREIVAATAASMDGMAALNEKEEYTFLNDAHVKIYGYDHPQDLIGKTWSVLYDEKELKRFKEEIMPKFSKEGRWRGEAVGKKRNGSLFPQEVSLTAIEGGGLVCVVRDVTDRKQAEEALKKSEALLRTIFDTIPHWVFVKDRKSRLLFVNKKMAEDHGASLERFINLPTKETPAAEEEGRAFSDYVDRRVIETGEQVDVPEEPFTGPDGKIRYFHMIKVPLKDSRNNIVGLVGIAEDITDKKKQAAELDNYRQHLEELVDERTRELRQSERLAATGRLAASMAHEINNPLQGITTHLDIMRGALPKNFRKTRNFEFVQSNMERIKGIVSRLLDMHKNIEEDLCEVDLNEMVRNVMTLIGPQLVFHKIDVELQLAEALPRIQGWKHQLHQVLLNLILNAQDSIKKKGKITITTVAQESSICVSIQDTGEGIKKENLDNIFDPFYTTKKEAGTGLGLFISQGIIREHKGDIKVKSQPGKGSTFTITLPVEPKTTTINNS